MKEVKELSEDEINNLKNKMSKKNMSLTDASYLIGKSRTYCKNCFSQKRMSMNSYLQLCKLLDTVDKKQKKTSENQVKIDSESLRHTLTDAGFHFDKLSLEMGWSHSYISMCLSYGTMRKDRAQALANFLKISADSFVLENSINPSSVKVEKVNTKIVNESEEKCTYFKKAIKDFINDEINLLSNLESLIN